ncbi:protein S-acyltransferase [Sarracenia purpurea var. burkii]
METNKHEQRKSTINSRQRQRKVHETEAFGETQLTEATSTRDKKWALGGFQVSSPGRQFSSSPMSMFPNSAATPQHKYRSKFDLKLTEASRELETYISRQVLCSILKKDGSEASPR